MPVDQRIAKRGIEREFVFDLPNGADQRRTGFRLRPYLVVKHLEHGPDFPGRGTFEDDVEEGLAVLIAGEAGLDIEMRGAPIPSLRHDGVPTKADPGVGVDTRQKRYKFHLDSRAGLFLTHARCA